MTAPRPSLPQTGTPAEIAALAARLDLWCHVDACVGGFMLPFARMLGQDIPDFDFALPGVTSISADLHKYGYAYRGCSVLCPRDKALEQWQGFATDAWNGGACFSKTVTGSRNAGPVASAWAVMQYLGVDGYMRITAQIIAMREAFLSGIRAMEGLEVIGTPQGPHFAFAAPGFDILSIARALVDRSWGINLGVRPDCIILLPSAHHLASAPEFLSDLETIMAQARAGTLLPPSDPSIFGIYCEGTMDIRKIVVQRETLLAEAGTQAASPVNRVIAAAVFPNPFAGRFGQDLAPLFELGAEIGARLVPEALAALGGPAVTYGKAALLGVNGDMEHGHALLHPKLGKPMRAAIGGGAALIPATVKLSSAGASLEVPLGHKDDLWSFEHIDTMTLSIADAPRPDEIVMAVAYADGARINARVPRL